MLDALTQRLSSVVKTLRGHSRITEDNVQEMLREGQLATLGKTLEVEVFPSDPSQKPVDIARAAVDWARRHYHDVVIVDTAGRLAIDAPMMDEVRALHAAVNPVETLFVVDAMQGQDA